jgi:hypothetical protein
MARSGRHRFQHRAGSDPRHPGDPSDHRLSRLGRTEAEPLHWERLLVRAVVELGRGQDAANDPEQLAQFEEALKQRYDNTANALGFKYDEGLDRFVLQPR